MIIKQINVSDDNNLAYIIADENTGEAAIIDPSFAPEKVLREAEQQKLKIKYLINTHGHHDHINGNNYILKKTSAELVSANKDSCNIYVTDGDKLQLGTLALQIIATPGHSPDSICILVKDKLFTGDTLFIGDVGITFSEEDARVEFASLKKLLQLAENIEIYPGHDYGSKPISTIGYEKLHNHAFACVLNNDFAQFLIEK